MLGGDRTEGGEGVDAELSVDEARASGDVAQWGLQPAFAGDWLLLQREMAWNPETIGDRLRAGISPSEIVSAWTTNRGRPAMLASNPRAGLARQTEKLDQLGIRVVPLTHTAYPRPLSELADAPLVLLVKGQVPALSEPAIAIVGARAATQSARSTARRLARDLAVRGLTVVSGLARGIDAEAHRGALEAGGRSVGVLACGPDQIYPPEHRRLADALVERGAVVSEMPLGVPPRRIHFPLRNRIISGLCLAVIVVEARRRSGSLITVRHALTQGREVFVVPGSIDGPFAEGTNHLLREGARPIRSAQDVIEDLGLPLRPEIDPSAAAASSGHRKPQAKELGARILAVLEDGPASRDALLPHAEFDVRELARVLLELELDGRVVEERDGRIHVVWR